MRVFECDAAQVKGRAVGNIFEDCSRSLDAELFASAVSFEDSLGDEKHACAGFEGLDGGLEGEMGEEAERHGDVSEDAGAVAVAKDGGLAAGVDVGEKAEGKVEAAEEGGGEAGPAGGLVDGLVDLVRQDS